MGDLREGASARELLEIIEDAVRSILGLEKSDSVDTDLPFVDLGFDSLAAVELARQIHAATGVELPLTVGFDYPTPAALADYVARLLSGDAELPAEGEDEGDESPARASAPARRRDDEQPAGDEQRHGEPIAVVGVACRLPGSVHGPDGLWSLLEESRDGTSEFPTDRGWELETLYSPDPDSSGTTYVKRGGFLDDALDFDAAFFGIGDREAQAMDPQQRLLLELAWEAFEDASIDPRTLRGAPVGVFVGLATHDHYGRLATAVPRELQGWFGIGNAGSVASGRIAYTLGLRGPALTVDTACSSSLVSIHLACQALRRGECEMALAGGATVLASPLLFVEFSRHRGLSPDGRCRSFAASADGTGWSEGAGLLILEPLSVARRNGHPVLAVVRGSAINQDGASNGLSAPNGPAQEAVIRAALADGDLEPDDVDAIEAHGTATVLGDPIELSALQAVFDERGSRGRPLYVGSLKSNIGHCQAAAGVAGVIKTVLALERGRLPATLHVDEPTPKVDWESSSLTLLTDAKPWSDADRPRRAGVSAFGISGTNAHVVLEQAPADSDARATGDGPVPLLVSGRDEDALRAAATALADHLEHHSELRGADVAHTLAGRHHQEHRAVVIGRDRDQLLAGLRGLAAGERRAAVSGATIPNAKLAVLFTGQGSQRAGMGCRLATELDTFAGAFDEVCAALDPHLERPLKEVVDCERGSDEASLINRTGWAQPALFAIEVALYRAAHEAGLRADLLAGHSIGEIAAAHVAGVLSLEDACALVAARARLMDALPAGGAMAAVFAPEDEVSAELPNDGRLVIAAVNGPRATVVSGDADALEEWTKTWGGGARKVRRLRVSHAFHSPLMEPMLDDFRKVAEGLSYSAPSVPIASTVTGTVVGEELATPGYWVDQVRRPVRFLDAVRTLREAGAAVFLEAGPGTALTQLAESAVAGDGAGEARLASLLRGNDELRTFVEGLASAHVAGLPVALDALPSVAGAGHVHVPPTPLQHRRFWALPATGGGSAGVSRGPVEVAGEDVWVSHERLSLRDQPWIADHKAGGAAVVPGAKYVDLALELGLAAGTPLVEELVLQHPLVVPETGSVELQLRASAPDDSGRRPLEIHARASEGAVDERPPWELLASGWLGPARREEPPVGAAPKGGEGSVIDLAELYGGAEAGGLRYGPAFRLVRRAWSADGEAVAELADGDPARGRVVDPALLDAALHALALQASESGARVPFSWSEVHANAGVGRLASVRLCRQGDDVLRLEGFTADGAPVLSIGAVHGRPLSQEESLRNSVAAGRRMFELAWQPTSIDAPAERPDLRIFEASEDSWPAIEDMVAAFSDDDEVLLRVEAPAADDAAALAATTHALSARMLETLQGWVDATPEDARLVVATRGAVAAGEGEVANPAAAALWGLVRSAQNEHPGGFALLDEERSDDALAGAAVASGLPQLALRGGQALRPGLRRIPHAPELAREAPRGTILVTGGTRGVGALVARQLAGQGAEHLLLVSRSGADGAEPGLVAELEERGARVTIAAADVSERDGVARALEQVPDDAPLRAVFHAAGAVRDGVVVALEQDALHEVLRPKVDAIAWLDEQTREPELDEFVVVSSLAGMAGAPGQANYAAANAFLDAFVQRRRAAGRPGLSLVYGVWGDGAGMAGDLDAAQAQRIGKPLSPKVGLLLLDAARGGDVPAPVLAELDPQRLASLSQAGMLPVVLETLVPRAGASRVAAQSLAQRLAAVEPDEREGEVLDLVLEEVAAVVGTDSADAVDAEATFSDIGFDSLKGVELRNRLAAGTGLQLPPTLVFDHPTPAELARLLLERAAPSDGRASGVEESLEQLAVAIGGDSLDDERRSRAATRLRDLLRQLEAGQGEADTAEEIASSSPEELYSFIETDLGIKVE